MKYNYHQYDINIIELYSEIKLFLEENEIKNVEVDASEYLKSVSDNVEYTCTRLGIDFNPNNYTPPVIIPSSDNSFHDFLSLSLAHYDIPKINSFLSYHKSIFKGNHYAPQNGFLGLVEYSCYDMVKRYSLTKTEERLDRIMQWVEQNKNKGSKEITKKNLKQLVWIRGMLILLSKKINRLGYTEKPTDFEKVFTEKKKTAWLKEPEFLAHLLYKLHHKDNRMIKPNKGKGVFKTAENYFHNYSEKTANYFDLADLSYKVRHNPEKYYKTRTYVDELISSIVT